VFFRLSSPELALLLLLIIVGSTAVGLVVGRHLRRGSDALREPFGVLQAAMLGIVALLLAFSLSLAMGRYEDRRAAVVDEANTIGTAYLRAQTLEEPMRTRSLALLRDYTDLAILASNEVPGGDLLRRTAADEEVIQRRLWRLAGRALAESPAESAPRLYVDSLNALIDQQTVRISALNNRVPATVLILDIVAAAVALGLLALYLSFLGRGPVTVLLASLLVAMLLFVTFDLDRPTRGLITVPDTPLASLRDSMELPPAAQGPAGG
jgi:hypothetical protein